MSRLGTSSPASEPKKAESEALESSDFGLARFDDVTDLVMRISFEDRKRLLDPTSRQKSSYIQVAPLEPVEPEPVKEAKEEVPQEPESPQVVESEEVSDAEVEEDFDDEADFAEEEREREEGGHSPRCADETSLSTEPLDFVVERGVNHGEVVHIVSELRPIDPAVDDIRAAFPIALSYEIEQRPQLIDMINHSIEFYLNIDAERIDEMMVARDRYPWVSYKISKSNQRIFTFDIRGGEFIWLQSTKTAKLVSAVGGLSTNFPASQNAFMPLVIFIGMIFVVIGFLLVNQGFLLNLGLTFCLAAAFAWLYYNLKLRLTLDVTTADFIVNERYQGPLNCLREIKEDSHGRIVAVIDFRQKQVEETIAPIIPREQRDYLIATLNKEINMLRQFERNV